MIYFDHNATTPIAEPVLEAMLPFLREQYGNASSRHEFGTQARKAVNAIYCNLVFRTLERFSALDPPSDGPFASFAEHTSRTGRNAWPD